MAGTGIFIVTSISRWVAYEHQSNIFGRDCQSGITDSLQEEGRCTKRSESEKKITRLSIVVYDNDWIDTVSFNPRVGYAFTHPWIPGVQQSCYARDGGAGLNEATRPEYYPVHYR